MNKNSIDTCGRCAGASDYLGSVFAVRCLLDRFAAPYNYVAVREAGIGQKRPIDLLGLDVVWDGYDSGWSCCSPPYPLVIIGNTYLQTTESCLGRGRYAFERAVLD